MDYPKRTQCPHCGGDLIGTPSGAVCFAAASCPGGGRVQNFRAPTSPEERRTMLWMEAKLRAPLAIFCRGEGWSIDSSGNRYRRVTDVRARRAYEQGAKLARTKKGRLIALRLANVVSEVL